VHLPAHRTSLVWSWREECTRRNEVIVVMQVVMPCRKHWWSDRSIPIGHSPTSISIVQHNENHSLRAVHQRPTQVNTAMCVCVWLSSRCFSLSLASTHTTPTATNLLMTLLASHPNASQPPRRATQPQPPPAFNPNSQPQQPGQSLSLHPARATPNNNKRIYLPTSFALRCLSA
jgi:hypothetical protein